MSVVKEIPKTAAQWQADIRIYPAQTRGYTMDGADIGKFKVFDGVLGWAALAYTGAGGGGGGSPTDLGYTPGTRVLTSSTGADVTLPLVSSDPGLMSAADKTKLDGLDPADYDPVGTAAASMSAHLAAGDPHSQYLTAAEGNAAYDPQGAASGAAAGAASALSNHEADTTGIHGITDTAALVLSSSAVLNSADVLAYQALGSPILAEAVNYPILTCISSRAHSDGTLHFTPVYLKVAATITGAVIYTVVQGSFTGADENSIALYSYSGGTLTRVAISANDQNIWKAAANTYSQVAFSATYAAAAGLYYVGMLYNQSAQTTAPAIIGGSTLVATAQAAPLLTNSAKLYSAASAQAAQAASYASSGLTGGTGNRWAALY